MAGFRAVAAQRKICRSRSTSERVDEGPMYLPPCLQDIHDRLSAAAKFGQRRAPKKEARGLFPAELPERQGQAWATLDMADAKLQQGLLQARMRPRKLIRSSPFFPEVPEVEDAMKQLGPQFVPSARCQTPRGFPKRAWQRWRPSNAFCDILHKA